MQTDLRPKRTLSCDLRLESFPVRLTATRSVTCTNLNLACVSVSWVPKHLSFPGRSNHPPTLQRAVPNLARILRCCKAPRAHVHPRHSMHSQKRSNISSEKNSTPSISFSHNTTRKRHAIFSGVIYALALASAALRALAPRSLEAGEALTGLAALRMAEARATAS